MNSVITTDSAVWSRYRVWMADGCTFQVQARTEREAMKDAVALAKQSILGYPLSDEIKRKAVIADRVQLLK